MSGEAMTSSEQAVGARAQPSCQNTIQRDMVHKILDQGFQKISESQSIRKLARQQAKNNSGFSESGSHDGVSSNSVQSSDIKLQRLISQNEAIMRDQ